jgi:hypothetical protein
MVNSPIQADPGLSVPLHMFSSGDQFGLPPERWVLEFDKVGTLLCQHVVSTRKDFHKQLQVETLGAFLLYGFLALLGGAALTRLNPHSDELKALSLALIGAIAVGSALHAAYQCIKSNPNHGSEYRTSIDIPRRQYHMSRAAFGKQPGAKMVSIPFDKLVLVCWENNDWEYSSSMDIAIAEMGEAGKALASRNEIEILLDLYTGKTMQDAMHVGRYLQGKFQMRFVKSVRDPNGQYTLQEMHCKAGGIAAGPTDGKKPKYGKKRRNVTVWRE